MNSPYYDRVRQAVKEVDREEFYDGHIQGHLKNDLSQKEIARVLTYLEKKGEILHVGYYIIDGRGKVKLYSKNLKRNRVPVREECPIHVIYENPKDYPGKFVVRAWQVG